MSWLVSRRSVLGAGLAVPALVACQRQRRPTEPPVPGAVQLDAALADEDRLLAAYDEAFASDPALRRALRRLRADHAAHRAALIAAGATVRPGTPSPSPLPPSPAQSIRRRLADAERLAAATRTDACLAAPRTLAPLFGSLAASEAAHAVALRA